MVDGIEFGDLIQCGPGRSGTVMSSGRISRREPLNARPMGERVAATMTASGMGIPFIRRWISRFDGPGVTTGQQVGEVADALLRDGGVDLRAHRRVVGAAA